MVLVTGGAGFVGSHIVDALVDRGHEVRVLDSILPVAHRSMPDYLNPGADFIHGDLNDPDTIDAALRDVDAVCHQASMVGLGKGFLDVAGYVHHNDHGTAVLLSRLAAAGFDGRLVLASSMVVYGEGRYQCAGHGAVVPEPRDVRELRARRFDACCPECGGSLEPRSIDESARLDPRNVYAATKVHQEHLCFLFGRETGVPVAALRYHNVFGPRMPRDTPYAGVAAIFASSLAAGESPRVYEDGGQLRDFVHVRDVAHANVLALTNPQAAAGAFNVASGRPRSVLALAEAGGRRRGARSAKPGRDWPVPTGRRPARLRRDREGHARAGLHGGGGLRPRNRGVRPLSAARGSVSRKPRSMLSFSVIALADAAA